MIAQSLLKKAEQSVNLKSLGITAAKKENFAKTNFLYSDKLGATLTVCVSAGNKPISDFKKLVCSLNTVVTPKFNLVYLSDNKIRAINDCFANFPEMFKINRKISILVEKNEFHSESLSHNKTLVFSKINKEKTEEKISKTVMNFRKGLFDVDASEEEVTHNEMKEYKDDIDFNIAMSHFMDSMASNREYLNFLEQYDSISNFTSKIKPYLEVPIIGRLTMQVEHSTTFDHNNLSIIYHSTAGNLFCSFLPDKTTLIQYTKDDEVNLLSNILSSDYGQYSRCLLILRPIMVRSGLNSIVNEILSINKFSIIKKIERMLTDSEVKLLFKIENLEQNLYSSYKLLMQESQVELFVVSKFNCVLF